ncbi:Uncharacterised protein [Bordetella pertussis]|nr:Uncharacterised protein [Bordetella pertussis]
MSGVPGAAWPAPSCARAPELHTAAAAHQTVIRKFIPAPENDGPLNCARPLR